MPQDVTGFVFPNETEVLWSLMIVVYPYTTGIVAGAFLVSSLYHVFKRQEFKPIARLAMVASLAFLLFATLPLLLHLGHPERAFNIVITPQFRSAMAAFGFIYAAYLVLLLLEIWLSYRTRIVAVSRTATGLKRWVFSALSLWSYDVSDAARRIDRKVIVVLAAIGIPAACILHGYVGFMFGSVKANPWWSSSLMPIIFLFSAMTSGVAMLVALYAAMMKWKGWRIEDGCMQSLSRWLWLFAILTVTLEILEVVAIGYENGEKWTIVGPLLQTKLAFSFYWLQLAFGSLIPIVLLGVVVTMRSWLHARTRNALAVVASLILLVQVFAMRWNVVIGGQIFSKSMHGFLADFRPEFLGKEGIAVALGLFALPFGFLWVFSRFLPLVEEPEAASQATDLERHLEGENRAARADAN